jgi:hypothetical protein
MAGMSGLEKLKLGSATASTIMDFGANYSDRVGNISALKSNASLLDVNAESIMASAMFNAQQTQKQGDTFVSRQIASYAKAGVKFEGSPAIVFSETVRNISLDKAIQHQNAVSQAIASGFQALNLRNQARFEKVNMWGDASQSLLKLGGQVAMAGAAQGSSSGMSIKGGGEMTANQVRGNTIYQSTTVR